MARIKMAVLAVAGLMIAVPGIAWSQQNNASSAKQTATVRPAALQAVVPASSQAVQEAAVQGNQQQASQKATQEGDADHPAPAQRRPRYQVQPDDVLSLTFPLSPELNQSFAAVQPDGYINLLSADSAYVKDLTVPEVTQAIKKAYVGILHDPIVEVDLVDFQRPFFLVSGQVGKPGQYDLRHETTVSEAIAMAGGFAPTAKTQVFLYHRTSTNWVEVKELSLKDILNGKNVNEDAYLGPGDMIFVPEKFITKFRKYVPYSLGTGTYVNPIP
jgi:polysaccharide export outer membrane protein